MKKPFFQYNWRERLGEIFASKTFFIGIVFIGVSLFGYKEEIKNQRTLLVHYRQQKGALKNTLLQKQNIPHELEELKNKIQHLTLTLQDYLPLVQEIKLNQAMDNLSQVATRAGLTVQSLRQHPQEKKLFYVEVPLEMVVAGTYHQLRIFIHALTHFPLCITLEDFVIRPLAAEGKEPLLINMVLKTYVYLKTKKLFLKEAFSQVEAASEISSLPSPFISFSPQKPIKAARLKPQRLGEIVSKNQAWVLFKDSDGKIFYRVIKGKKG